MTNVKRLLDEATPLPWFLHHEWNGEPSAPFIMDCEDGECEAPRLLVNVDSDAQYGEANAALIVYAVNLLPRFLTLYEEAATVINSDEAFNADDSSRMPALAAAVDALAELDE